MDGWRLVVDGQVVQVQVTALAPSHAGARDVAAHAEVTVELLHRERVGWGGDAATAAARAVNALAGAFIAQGCLVTATLAPGEPDPRPIVAAVRALGVAMEADGDGNGAWELTAYTALEEVYAQAERLATEVSKCAS